MIKIFESFLVEDDEEYATHKEEVQQLLRNVFNPHEIDGFVRELVDGRFNIDVNQLVKRSVLHQTVKTC